MRVHRHLVDSILESLEQTFKDGYHADKVLERQFKSHKKWGSRDRKFVAETFYDCVRWFRKLLYVCEVESSDFSVLSKDDYLKALSAYLYLTKEIKLENAPISQWDRVQSRFESGDMPRAIQGSVTDWLDRYGFEQFQEEWPEIIHSLNHQADLYLRTNTLKVTRDQLLGQLKGQGYDVAKIDETPEAIVLKTRKNLFVTDEFKKGFFEVQDVSSQKVGHLLNPQKGEWIIDACSGAGGKALHMAALMQNKGKIISLDIHQRKLDEQKKRRRRSGADIIEIKLIESSKTTKRLKGKADGLLLDVPCSGSGVFKRNPDTKWKLSGSDIERLLSTQMEIVSNYSKMVKPSGRMVYATCSIFPDENNKQVHRFLDSEDGQGWQFEEDHFMDPRDGFDGFYAALLRRS